MIKTLILDFDGTIADTRNSIIQTVQMTMKELGFFDADESVIENLIGLPLKETFINILPEFDEVILKKAIGLYREKYNEICLNTVQLYPNVKETLKLLYDNGTIIAIASSKGKEALSVLLRKMDIYRYIFMVLGEQDVNNKKPAPDMVLRILEETKSIPQEALVIGDTIYDIEMGQRAECTTCAVTYGNHSENRLRKQGANYIINDFIEVIPIIKN